MKSPLTTNRRPLPEAWKCAASEGREMIRVVVNGEARDRVELGYYSSLDRREKENGAGMLGVAGSLMILTMIFAVIRAMGSHT